MTLAAVFDLAMQRAARFEWSKYDPRQDLKRRTGVDLKWHNNQSNLGRFSGRSKIWGLTNFSELSVSLHVHLSSVQMRGSLAHELVHLDRGPFAAGRESQEENKVDLIAAQRLIDPVVFDALMEATDGNPGKQARHLILDVDKGVFEDYLPWRRKVTKATAVRRWQQALEPTPWPAPWIEEHADRWPIAAAYGGVAAREPAST